MKTKKVYIPINKYLEEVQVLDNETVKDILKDNMDKIFKLKICVDIPDERGTIIDDSHRIQYVEVNSDGEGTVAICFEWEAYYGCRDMNKIDVEEIYASLKIDFKEKVIILEADLPPEKRSYDPEEF